MPLLTLADKHHQFFFLEAHIKLGTAEQAVSAIAETFFF